MFHRSIRVGAVALALACGKTDGTVSDTAAPAAVQPSASTDTAVVRARPDLERAFASFDPATLNVADAPVRLGGTCGSEGGAEKGIVPATIRMLDLQPHNPGVLTRLEVVSVADVTPVGGDDVCNVDTLRVTPRIDTLELHLALFWNPVDGTDHTERAEWYTDATAWIEDERKTSVALVGVGESTVARRLPPGATMQQLRARIDSIRAARRD
jgi:hypothetical protein